MLRDRWRAHVELAGDVTGGKLARGEHLDDALARGIGKGVQDQHDFMLRYYLIKSTLILSRVARSRSARNGGAKVPRKEDFA
jgi:hypothetical protein